MSTSVAMSAARTSAPRIRSALWNPTVLSSRPPTKNPTPFSAFFEPVRMETHVNSAPGASSGTTSLTALLALIFVRSLAMPDSAWATMTYATTSHDSGTRPSIASATSCVARPASSVTFSPSRAATNPPTRFVTIPNSS